eukprot:3545027-Rhodomonas_salina.1
MANNRFFSWDLGGFHNPEVVSLLAILQLLLLHMLPTGLYATQFVGAVDDDLLCTICHNVMVKLHVCQQGHTFCHGCICKWMERSPTCPTDRQALSESSLTKHRLASNLIGKLRVCCLNASVLQEVQPSSSACTWTGQLEEREKHLEEDCAFVEKECPYQCHRK